MGERQRRYYWKNHEKELARAKKYRKENKEKIRRWCLRWKRKKYKEAVELLGDRCFFCARKVTSFHEKFGQRHRGRNTAYLVTKNPEKFVSLCFPHHQAVHFCMEILNMSWKQIERKYKTGE